MVFVIIIGSFAGGARNVSANYYSSYCLGAWQNPQLSGGQPSLEKDAVKTDFNQYNSSVLENSLASIFCGYFQAPQLEDSPKEVRARFSWYVDFGVVLPENSVEGISPEVTEGQVPESHEPAENNQIIAVPEPDNEQSVIAPKEVEGLDSEQIPQEDEPSVDEDIPTEESLPDSVSSTFLKNFLIHTANAQGLNNNGYGFAQIKYSFNGRDWMVLKTVDASNWKNLSVAVPVDTWEEVQNLQIAVVPLQTIDVQPVIFLDGIWIEVDYRQSLSETVREVVDNTIALIEGVMGIFGSESEGAEFAEEDPQVAEDVLVVENIVETGEVAGLSVSGATSKPDTYSFRLTGDLLPTLKILPWMSRSDLTVLGTNFDALNKASPKFITDTTGAIINLSGTCRMQYYVLLMFKNNLDYVERPGEFILNQAELCTNGSYTIDLFNSTLPVKSGSYYLLVAEQELDSVWSPISPLIPITITQNP